MIQKLVPYGFAIGSMIVAMALVQSVHSIYDHFVNHTEEVVSAFLFGAFAVTGYLGYLLAKVAAAFALKGDLHRNNHYAVACYYELRRIGLVLLLVSLVQFFVLGAKDTAIVAGIAGVLLFLYAWRIAHRVQNYPYKVNTWFKIF